MAEGGETGGDADMTIIDDLTPVHYQLVRIDIRQDESDVLASAELRILNAAGVRVSLDLPSTTLTPGEKTALAAFIARELGVYETATGLTEWEEPEP